MRLIITGPPGAGKGTQAQLIKEAFQIPHISTGEMFRNANKKQSELGILAYERINRGELVPDDITVKLVRERLQQDDAKQGFLLDGFPRTKAQAIAFDKLMVESNVKLDAVINLFVEDSELVSRIVGRRVCTNCGASYHVENNPPKQDGICDVCKSKLIQRNDDTEETVLHRIEVYHAQTKPILEHFNKQKIVFNVDGTGDIQETFLGIKAFLEGLK